jgi:hypothetical protein
MPKDFAGETTTETAMSKMAAEASMRTKEKDDDDRGRA